MKNTRLNTLILWLFALLLCWQSQTASAQARLIFDEPDTIATPQRTTHKDTVINLDFKQLVAPDDLSSEKSDSIRKHNAKSIKALESPADTAQLYAANDSIRLINGDVKLPKKRFVPDPQRAVWLALVFPGAGQIYNRKYWKLPLIYGGFLGCTYALLWNQQMYMDYSQAYLDIMDDDPNTDSYKDMLPPRYNIEGQEERFKKIFKNKKDHFRRYRDLSAFCFVGVYLLSVVDAYVDAQLSEFDITPELSLRLEPAVIQQNGLNKGKNAYGVGCSINF